MVQKYGRDVSKDANEDVKELVYWITEEKIQITYHTGDPKVISSTREYIKPQGAEEKGSPVIMTADMHTTFQVIVFSLYICSVNLRTWSRWVM